VLPASLTILDSSIFWVIKGRPASPVAPTWALATLAAQKQKAQRYLKWRWSMMAQESPYSAKQPVNADILVDEVLFPIGYKLPYALTQLYSSMKKSKELTCKV
jgi:hypothetical protein